ncbi:MAG TPA: hypothetical protein VF868_17295 [Bacteroidia bacterium]|jgi:hypothetical protein
MKTNSVLLFLLAACFSGCSPSTSITGSWKSPTTSKQYKRILVAAFTANTIARATLENDMTGALKKHITVLKSIDEFPPTVSNSDSSKSVILDKMKGRVDAILSVSIISQETETRYVQGGRPYDPLYYSYYNDFWGYYSYRYPSFYNPGYYEQNKVYFIETNLYDAENEKLIWSAQSKTYTPDHLEPFSKEFANIIVAKMQSDKIIPPAVEKKKDGSPEGY